MTLPTKLFKYLPRDFVDTVRGRGDLLFRNLSYFRRIEEVGRNDLLEGLHMDRPDNDITIEAVDGGLTWKGPAAFLNSINHNRLLIFCLSEVLSEDLYTEFGADACIELVDPEEFIRRCQEVVCTQPRFAESGLLHNRVEYYAPNAPAIRSVKDPRCIPFFKHQTYSRQREYRLAVALRGGLKMTQRIVNEQFTFDEELAAGRSDHRHVFIGPIEDITRVHLLQEARCVEPNACTGRLRRR